MKSRNGRVELALEMPDKTETLPRFRRGADPCLFFIRLLCGWKIAPKLRLAGRRARLPARHRYREKHNGRCAHLKIQLRAHLDGALIVLCPRATSETRTAECCPRVAEIHEVEGVECFRAVLKPKAFREPEVLENSDIEILEPGSTQRVAAQVPEGILRGDCKGGRIEVQPARTIRARPAGREGI